MKEATKKYINNIEKKQEENPFHWQFRKATGEVRIKGLLEKGYLKKETESTIIAAQNQALCTNCMKNVFMQKTLNPSVV